MRFHYAGKYDGNPESLPTGEHRPGAVKFKEAETSGKLAVISTVISLVVLVLAGALMLWRCLPYVGESPNGYLIGLVLSIVCMVPHEMLHALCFKGDVYMYSNLRQGMLFVIGPEDMSKGRFIFMSLLPALVLGVLPMAIALVDPRQIWAAVFGVFSFSMASGDFYNVFNALTQMPKGSRTYLHGFNSYWYLPE